jgi:hypothetical protein
MTHDHVHGHDEVVEKREVVREPGDSMTSYAAVKYAFILLITIVILWFVAKYLIPLVTG